MTTIVNSPAVRHQADTSLAVMFLMLLFITALLLCIEYGLPYLIRFTIPHPDSTQQMQMLEDRETLGKGVNI